MRIPRRDNFVGPINSAKIAASQPINFMPSDCKIVNVRHNNRTQMVMVLFGILECGTRCTTLLTGVDPYFYIWAMEDAAIERDVVYDALHSATVEDYTRATGIKVLEYSRNQFPLTPSAATIEYHKKLMYYRDYKTESKFACIKLAFSNLKKRQLALNYIKACEYETAEEESTSTYHRAILRDHEIQPCKWYTLKSYSEFIQTGEQRFKDDIVLILDIANYTMSEYQPKDRMITLAWDIETFSPSGALPRHEDDDCKIFMIGMSFHWYSDPEPLVRVCLTDYDIGNTENFTSIYCVDEKGLIATFAEVIDSMQPEFIIAFNDSQYDWPWIIERARKHGIFLPIYKSMAHECIYIDTDADAYRYGMSRKEVKYEAGKQIKTHLIRAHGSVSVDLMIECRRAVPSTESHSLNSFLEIYKLPSKKDMPIHIMNAHYRSAMEEITQQNIENYTQIAEYCVFDAQSCQNLMIRGNFIITARSMANMAHMSLYDIFYYGIGVKILNFVIKEGKRRDFILSQQPSNARNISYPGAHVVKPTSGLFKPKLSMAERRESMEEWHSMSSGDIEALQEIVQKYGHQLSEKTMDTLQKEVPALEKSHVRSFFREEFRSPIIALDFAALYPSLMMAYNISPDMVLDPDTHDAKDMIDKGHILVPIDFALPNGDDIRGLVVWHRNKTDPSDPEFLFGLFPSILNGLKVARKKLQNEVLLPLAEKIKTMTKNGEEGAELTDLQYQHMMVNSVQLAQKVFMNSLYGEAGRSISPLYMIQVSGGVTQYGRQNLEKVVNYLTGEENCTICYGDTDSCYFTCPELLEEECKKYYSGHSQKEEFMYNCINIAIGGAKKIQVRVNDFLRADNRTDFLTMSYEEVLYPALFLSKKMYMGIPHTREPNFKSDTIVKGLTSKKRGTSQLHKIITNNLIARLMDLNNTYSVWENIQKLIHEVYRNKKSLDLDTFVCTAEYRPSVQNIRVINFVQRMKSRGIEIMPAERFRFVYTKLDKYHANGTNRKLNASDYMELATTAREKNLEIDFDQYFTRGIDNQLAAFISDHPDFEGKSRIDNAKKFIESWRRDQFLDGEKQLKLARKANYGMLKSTIGAEYGSCLATELLMKSMVDTSLAKYILDDVDADAKRYPGGGAAFVSAVLRRKKKCFNGIKGLYTRKTFEKINDDRITVLYNRFCGKMEIFAQWSGNMMAKITDPKEMFAEPEFAEMRDILMKLTTAINTKYLLQSIREAFLKTEEPVYTN